MTETTDITAFIIAGGKSRRFGEDKLLYEHKGITLVERVINTLNSVFKKIKIIANDKTKFSFLNIPVLPDIIPGIGPIVGIYSALEYSETHKAFCFAADLPFLNTDFIEYMISISDNFDITVPSMLNGYYEALHAIYTKECLERFKDNIISGKYKITDIYDKCNLRKVSETEILKFSDPARIFKNINFMKDLEEI